MRIQIASDLHLESIKPLPPVTELIVPSADTLGLLGDIFTLRQSEDYEAWLTECLAHFKRVLVLLGNHEFYHCSTAETTVVQQLRGLCQRVSAAAPLVEGIEERVVLLENECVEVESSKLYHRNRNLN